MPNVLLPAPRFEQSRDGACLPACARMVLAYWGDMREEAGIAALLGTRPFGTPLSNIVRLKVWGYNAVLDSLSRPTLVALLDEGIPVIARVWTPMLDYWSIETSHVVLVAGYDEGVVYVNDPAFPALTQAVPWDAFLAAWAEFDETAVIVRPSHS